MDKPLGAVLAIKLATNGTNSNAMREKRRMFFIGAITTLVLF